MQESKPSYLNMLDQIERSFTIHTCTRKGMQQRIRGKGLPQRVLEPESPSIFHQIEWKACPWPQSHICPLSIEMLSCSTSLFLLLLLMQLWTPWQRGKTESERRRRTLTIKKSYCLFPVQRMRLSGVLHVWSWASCISAFQSCILKQEQRSNKIRLPKSLLVKLSTVNQGILCALKDLRSWLSKIPSNKQAKTFRQCQHVKANASLDLGIVQDWIKLSLWKFQPGVHKACWQKQQIWLGVAIHWDRLTLTAPARV